MATFTWSGSAGDPGVLSGTVHEFGVLENSPGATLKVSEKVEVTVELGNIMDGNTRQITREEVLAALLRIEGYITQGNWPPA
jgi:hypothetical protein